MNLSLGLDIRIVDDQTAYVCGIGSCTDEHLVIPCQYDGIPVVGISEKAFCRNSSVKSITLPCSVLYIEYQAFAWCRNLEIVQFSSVEKIGDRAFIGCDRLNTLIFGNFVQQIGEKAFAYCSALESITVPDSVFVIGTSAFEGCRNLNAITLSNRIHVIESGTFYACEKLKYVKLPRDLSYIDDFSFAYCISLSNLCLPPKAMINSNAFFECGSILNNKVS